MSAIFSIPLNSVIAKAEDGTHDIAIESSVAHFLVRLDKAFSTEEKIINSKSSLPGADTIYARFIEKYLKPYCSGKTEKYRELIHYIHAKRGEDINDWDKPRHFNGEAEITMCFPITVFLPKLIAFLEDTDGKFFPIIPAENQESERKERMNRLIEEIESLSKKGLCHIGVRHGLVGSLAGLKAVLDREVGEEILDFPVTVESYVSSLIKEKILSVLEERKIKDFNSYVEIMLVWSTNPTSPTVEAFIRKELLSESAGLRVWIEQKLISKGINPVDAKCIEAMNRLLELEALRLQSPQEEDVFWNHFSCLNTIKTGTPRQATKKEILLKKIQESCLSLTEMKNLDLEISDFILAQELFWVSKNYSNTLIRFNGEHRTNVIEAGIALANYFAAERNVLSHQERTKLEDFKKLFKDYQKDPQVKIINSFFAILFSLGSKVEKEAFAKELSDPEFQKKFILSDVEITQILSKARPIGGAGGAGVEEIDLGSAELEITPYEVNKLFMSALVKPLTSWTPIFTHAFNAVLNYVDQKLGTQREADWGLNESFKESSYPAGFLNLLKMLQRAKLPEAERSGDFSSFLFLKNMEYAVENGFPSSAFKLLSDAFVSCYPDPRARLVALNAKFGVDQDTALMIAAQRWNAGAVTALLEAFPDPESKLEVLNAKDRYEYTPLMFAAQGGKADTVTALLKALPDVDSKLEILNAKDCYENTALMLAVQGGKADTVTALLKALPDVDSKLEILNAKDPYEYTALMFAAQGGNAGTVTALLAACPEGSKLAILSARDRNEKTALMLAAETGNAGTVTALLKALPDVDSKLEILNAQDDDGNAALSLAVLAGNAGTVTALLAACPEGSKLAILNAKDRDGNTALMLGSQNWRAGIVTALLEAFPNLESKLEVLKAQNLHGVTALILAARNGNADAVTALLADCPDGSKLAILNAKNKFGMTTLMLAAQKGNAGTVTALLEAFPDVGSKLDILNAKDCYGNTALMLAAMHGNAETVTALLTAFPDVKSKLNALMVKNQSGNTAQTLADSHGYSDIAMHLNCEESEQLAILNTKNDDGSTALVFKASTNASPEFSDVVKQIPTPC